MQLASAVGSLCEFEYHPHQVTHLCLLCVINNIFYKKVEHVLSQPHVLQLHL